MKRLLLLITPIILGTFTATLKSECEDCKKMRDELHKSWQATLSFSKEIRELTKETCRQAESIRKLNGGL
jgi:uncharacterized coiled-coil DUF342 family protein